MTIVFFLRGYRLSSHDILYQQTSNNSWTNAFDPKAKVAKALKLEHFEILPTNFFWSQKISIFWLGFFSKIFIENHMEFFEKISFFSNTIFNFHMILNGNLRKFSIENFRSQKFCSTKFLKDLTLRLLNIF